MSCSPRSWNNMFLMLGSDRDTRLLKDCSRTMHSSALKGFFTAKLYLLNPIDSWEFLLLLNCIWRINSYCPVWLASNEQLPGPENQGRWHSLWKDNWLNLSCCFMDNHCFPHDLEIIFLFALKGHSTISSYEDYYTSCENSCITFSQALEELCQVRETD